MGKLVPKTDKKITKRQSRKALQTINAIMTTGSITKASQLLGISRSALYDRITNYNLAPMIQEIKKEVESDLILSSPKALENIKEIANTSNKVQVKLQANQDILDRAGITKKDPTNQINIASQDMRIEFVQD